MVNSTGQRSGVKLFVKNLEADSTYMFLVRAFSSKAVGLPSVISDSDSKRYVLMVKSRGQRSGSSYFVKNLEA